MKTLGGEKDGERKRERGTERDREGERGREGQRGREGESWRKTERGRERGIDKPPAHSSCSRLPYRA